MNTRSKNIRTLNEFNRYLKTQKLNNFLSDIKKEILAKQLVLPNINEISAFSLECLKFELSLDEKSYELKDVFNNIVPDEKIPYVYLIQDNEFFAKIYQKSVFSEDWLKMEDQSPQNKEKICFKIQTPNKPKEKNFIYWSESKVLFNFKLSEITSLKNIYSLMETFKTWLTNLVKNTKLVSKLKSSKPKIVFLGGRFTISNFTLNPEIFSEYVTNDPVAQKYLFFDEYQKKEQFEFNKINTILTKPNITVFFDILEPKGTLISYGMSPKRSYIDTEKNPLTSVKLTIIPDNEKKNINIRISKMYSIDNITIVLQHLVALTERFKNQKESIINKYKEVDLVLPFPIFSTKPSKPSKPPSRLNNLKTFDPQLFGNNYARFCQINNHPIGLRGNSDEIDKYLNDHSTYLQDKNPPFKLNYSYGAQTSADVKDDKWYVCVPPRPMSTNIYPYLIEAKHKANQKGLLDYDKKRPFVPCCGMSNTKLKNWLSESKTEKKETILSPIQPDKILKKGAKGKLPLAIQNAWNDEDNSYIRIGVEKTPKSFFLCLSLALNEEVSVIQNKIIEGIKTDCTQETFGYTSSQLEKIIKTEYINPKLFLGIAQNVMNVQIFLYAVTKKFSKGDIVYPRTAFAYLTPLESFNRSIVIVIQEDINIPQCELIIRTGKKEQKVFLPDDSLVTTCKNIVIRSSRVFRVNTENLS